MYSFALQKISVITEKGTGMTPGPGTKIPQAMWCSQKKKKVNFLRDVLSKDHWC